MRALRSLQIADLHFPFMCLVDYRGYRLICMSVLPIDSDRSLVYGSDDGGQTVHTAEGHEELREKIREIGKRLKLKEHGVGKGGKSQVIGPGDMEVHVGSDGKYYLLDLARLFPPEGSTVQRDRQRENTHTTYSATEGSTQ